MLSRRLAYFGTPAMAVPPLQALVAAGHEVALVVTRVTDQNPGFLRFVEQHDLAPSRPVTIVGRDDAADTVRLRGGDGAERTIGIRAASKILVRRV